MRAARQLDCLPWVVGTQEWDELEAGLRQRSRLLEHILDDLYGARRIISEGLLPPELQGCHFRADPTDDTTLYAVTASCIGRSYDQAETWGA